MFTIQFPDVELFNNETQTFSTAKGREITLEHSLKSVALWESKWHKPFFSAEQKTWEQTVSYIQCMTVSKHVDPVLYLGVTPEIVREVNNYIEDPMTATWFTEEKNVSQNREVITAEIVYYWMIALNIPFECQTWHFNRLMTLIKVCNIKNSPKKKMSKQEVYARNRALNAQRRKSMNTRG